jgi:hypothetical protein
MAKDPFEKAVAPLSLIPFSYDHSKGEASALELVFTLYPGWKTAPGPVNVVRFTDGIMNTVGYLFEDSLRCI